MRKAHAILFFGLTAFLACGPAASAQSFKQKIKKATEEVGQQVKQEVGQHIKQEVAEKIQGKTQEKASGKIQGKSPAKSSADKSAASKSAVSSSRQGGSQSAKNKAVTIDLPQTHTALFAPLGEQDAKYGSKSVPVSKPPKEETEQVAWNESRVSAWEFDNKSLVEEFLLLDECMESRYFTATSPAFFPYCDIKDELNARIDALEEMVEQYNEAHYEYAVRKQEGAGYEDQWVIDLAHHNLARVLQKREYHALVRSSIAPLFTMKGTWIDDGVREYFEAHGGYENAHKADLTVWDPDPAAGK